MKLQRTGCQQVPLIQSNWDVIKVSIIFKGMDFFKGTAVIKVSIVFEDSSDKNFAAILKYFSPEVFATFLRRIKFLCSGLKSNFLNDKILQQNRQRTNKILAYTIFLKNPQNLKHNFTLWWTKVDCLKQVFCLLSLSLLNLVKECQEVVWRGLLERALHRFHGRDRERVFHRTANGRGKRRCDFEQF